MATSCSSALQPSATKSVAQRDEGTWWQSDQWMQPYADVLHSRRQKVLELRRRIEQNEYSLDRFSLGYKRFGFNVSQTAGGISYREYAPNAVSVTLFGDFNGWNRDSSVHKLRREEFGSWHIFLPNYLDGSLAIPHGSKVKICIELPGGEKVDRIPAWIKRVEQEAGTANFNGIFWEPDVAHEFQYHQNRAIYKTERISAESEAKQLREYSTLRIYEVHVGMSSTEPTINSYAQFTQEILPYIADLGYNCIQLMAIMEHSYYASFGYQVTNFFAVCSRYGTPEDLKRLIDRAHQLRILVILDLVHSHASKNVQDGLNMFDGTDSLYFHGGVQGHHPLWDSRLFNYGNWETLRFLLSNMRWFMEEYQFDGFRFDGVTSMLYHHHGVGVGFTGELHEYYDDSVDEEALAFLTLANELLHELYPNIITIAEDVSGMPGMCIPTAQGGIGFDYRMAMAIPDMWIKLLKEVQDEHWNMGHIWYTLNNRRANEKHVSYAESHDQSLVGDKTLAFWLMDKAMYDEMSILQPISPVVDRGISLHKMIRLITCALGGEAYLTFMGNEFGHPEWVDFPREGNGWSYKHARRQWNLCRDPLLRYQHLRKFDQRMMHLERRFKFMGSPQAFVSLSHEEKKLLVFERGNLLWIFNFHPCQSYTDLPVPVSTQGKYEVVLESDAIDMGGHARIDCTTKMFSQNKQLHNVLKYSILVYSPSRTAMVLRNVDLDL